MVTYLNCHKNRTEFKMLQQLTDVKLVDFDNLEQGSLLIPGVVLKSLTKENARELSKWISFRANHLILTPAWINIDLKKVLAIKPEVKIEASSSGDNGDYTINTSVNSTFYQEGSIKKGIRFRNNTSSCLITVTTLPVLDYRHSISEDKRRDWWKTISLNDSDSGEVSNRKPEAKDLLSVEDKMILLLFGAQIPLFIEPEKVIKKYFGTNLSTGVIKSSVIKLEKMGLVNETSLTVEGLKLIQSQNLDSFQDVLIKRKENSDDWD